jgi:hypothetical protein
VSPISPQVVVDAFIAKINAHDAREVIACCTSDHVFIDSLGMRITAAWRARVSGQLIAEWQIYGDNKPVYEILSGNA